jgi:hypothetical protein
MILLMRHYTRQLIATALSAKAATPLDRMELSPEAKAAVTAYDVYRARSAELSAALLAANRAINVIKEQAAADGCARAS